MAIRLPSGFVVTAQEPVDNRLTLTKAEMLAIARANMPDKYICLCKDDKRLYIYDKTVAQDPEIGYFRLYEAPVDQEDMADKLPGAIDMAMQATGGAEEMLGVMFDTDHFKTTANNKIDIAINLIQAIDED